MTQRNHQEEQPSIRVVLPASKLSTPHGACKLKAPPPIQLTGEPNTTCLNQSDKSSGNYSRDMSEPPDGRQQSNNNKQQRYIILSSILATDLLISANRK